MTSLSEVGLHFLEKYFSENDFALTRHHIDSYEQCIFEEIPSIKNDKKKPELPYIEESKVKDINPSVEQTKNEPTYPSFYESKNEPIHSDTLLENKVQDQN
jgi:hypothetical protein